MSSSSSSSSSFSHRPSPLSHRAPPPPSEGDFPSLAPSTKGTTSGAWGADKRFSDLARSWGVEQKEKEEEEKKLSKQKATEDMRKREHEAKERAFYRVTLAQASQLIYKNGVRQEDAGVYDLGGAKPLDTEDSDRESDMYLPEEEEERGVTAGDWNSRKSKHDLY